jgi:hypothetical protein
MPSKTGFTYDQPRTLKKRSVARDIIRGTRPVLFMDCDGVLNGHQRHGNGYCGTSPENVANMNAVIEATDCLIVIVSAWRYLVHSGAMEVQGLEALLMTHGLNCKDRIIGVTRTDASPDNSDRGAQAIEWLERHDGRDPVRFAAVDDLTLDYLLCGTPWVETNGMVGLQDADAEQLIRLLTDEPCHPVTKRCDLCKKPSLADNMVCINLRATGKATVYDRERLEACRGCRVEKRGGYRLVV